MPHGNLDRHAIHLEEIRLGKDNQHRDDIIVYTDVDGRTRWEVLGYAAHRGGGTSTTQSEVDRWASFREAPELSGTRESDVGITKVPRIIRNTAAWEKYCKTRTHNHKPCFKILDQSAPRYHQYVQRYIDSQRNLRSQATGSTDAVSRQAAADQSIGYEYLYPPVVPGRSASARPEDPPFDPDVTFDPRSSDTLLALSSKPW